MTSAYVRTVHVFTSIKRQTCIGNCIIANSYTTKGQCSTVLRILTRGPGFGYATASTYPASIQDVESPSSDGEITIKHHLPTDVGKTGAKNNCTASAPSEGAAVRQGRRGIQALFPGLQLSFAVNAVSKKLVKIALCLDSSKRERNEQE